MLRLVSFCVWCLPERVAPVHVRPSPFLSALHHSPRGCCHLAEHRSAVCSVCKPVHAADKLLAFRYPLIERQNTQIDSAALWGFAHRHTNMHALRYLDWENLQTCMCKHTGLATNCLKVMISFSSGVIKCNSWRCHNAQSTISLASKDAVCSIGEREGEQETNSQRVES